MLAEGRQEVRGGGGKAGGVLLMPGLVKLLVCQMGCNGEGVPTRISHPAFQQVAEPAGAEWTTATVSEPLGNRPGQSLIILNAFIHTQIS